jgi:hypothetical protein
MTAGAAGFRRTQDLRSAQNHDETVSFDQNQDERKSEGRGISTAAELGILRRSWIGTRSRRKPQETRWERRSGEGFTNGGSVKDLWRRWGWEELAAI